MRMMVLPMIAAMTLAAAPAAAQMMAAPDYVAAAGASDLYETKSSQLVLKTSKDPKVRAYATMMISDHRKSTADVKKAAMQAKVKAGPPRLMPEQTDMIAQLTATSGTARDATYITQQKMSHDKALALHQGYAQSGDAAPLQAAAGKIVPVVQHHVEMLQSMPMTM